MNLKFYLRGLGTGIFVTTMILSIAFEVRTSKLDGLGKADKETGHSYGEESGTSEILSQKETQSESTSADEATEATTEEVTTEAETTVQATEVTTAVPQSATVTIDIYSGMSSNKVAARLEELGVVDDADEFNNYMYSKHIENSIRIGRYEIPQDASYDEIIAAITARH